MKRPYAIKLDNLFVSLSQKGPALFHKRRVRGSRRHGITISPVNETEKELIAEQHPEVAKQFRLK